jgi:hypothetical protein
MRAECTNVILYDFGGRRPGVTTAEVQARFTETLSRSRPKELAHDYLEREAGSHEATVSNLVARRGRMTETQNPRPGCQQLRHRLTTSTPANKPPPNAGPRANRFHRGEGRASSRPTHKPSNNPERRLDRTPGLRRDGSEDHFDL